MLTGRHLIQPDDLSVSEINEICSLAEQIIAVLAWEDRKEKLETLGRNAEAYFLKHFVKADLMDEMIGFIEN